MHPSRRREAGAALFVTVLVLVLVALLALASIRNAEEESTGGGRSLSNSKAFHAADAGIQLALTRLMQSPPNLNPINVALTSANVQSRRREQTSAQALQQVGNSGADKDGYSVNVGASVGLVQRVFVVNSTSTDSGSTVELEAKLARSEVEATAY
jgi:Tfp pilus assembly protein PilX